jgi:glutamyl-tRNA reductase
VIAGEFMAGRHPALGDRAENRFHAQKAIPELLMVTETVRPGGSTDGGARGVPRKSGVRTSCHKILDPSDVRLEDLPSLTATSFVHHDSGSDGSNEPERLRSEAPVPRPFLLCGVASSIGHTRLDDLEAQARSMSRTQIRSWISRLDATEEVAVLSTCHRVELFLLVRSAEELDRWLTMLPGPGSTWQVREGAELVRHLFRVAAGRESLAQGEVEVRQQVRAARRRIESRHPRPVLNDLFSAAIDAAERVAPPDRPARSIAGEAARTLRGLVDRPAPRVLIIGAGAVGRQVAELLAPTSRVTLAYHLRPPSAPFLRATGVRSIPLEKISEELGTADAIVTAIKSGTPCLRATDLPADRPVVLIDLGMPRNIDPRVRELPLARLVDLEELYSRSSAEGAGGEEARRLDDLADRYSSDLDRRLREVWVQGWLRSVEDVRRAEVDNARRFWGALTLEQEVAVDRLTRRLVTRLFVPPARRLRALPAGPEGDLRRRFAWELLGPDPGEP